MSQEFDLVVIGGGSAGVTAALEAVQQGASVALVERSGRYGGTCRYTGCMPSKTLLHTAQTLHTMRKHAAKLGLPSVEPDWDFIQVMRHKDDIIRRAGGADGYGAPSAFFEAGGKTFTGVAAFRSSREVMVGEARLHARRFIIATGSRPAVAAIHGLKDVDYLTWETVFNLESVPRALVIIGGGPLAVEFGQMFQRFGSAVTVLEVAKQILPQADQDAALALRQVLEAEGVHFHTDVEVASIQRNGDGYQVVLKNTEPTQLQASHILVATGTQPNTQDLNLGAAGIELTDKGLIKVDEQLRTTADGIYACGDVATHYQFTHIADYEAKLAVANALQNAGQVVDERVVPWAVYTQPTLAHVGQTEQQVREQGIDYVTAQLAVNEIERSLLVEQQAGLFKALVERKSGRLLGVSIVSERADDLIHEAALAMRNNLPVQAIANTIHAYPTFSQGVQQVAAQLAAKLHSK